MDGTAGATGSLTTEPEVTDRSTTPAGVGPRTVPEADVFRFDDVDQAGGWAHGPAARRGLALTFDDQGIEIAGPRPGGHTVLPWSEITWTAIGASAAGADGRTETTVEVESTAGLASYVVRSDHPVSVAMSALEVQATRWQSSARAATAVPSPVAAVTVEAVSAGVPTGTTPPGIAPTGVPPRSVPELGSPSGAVTSGGATAGPLSPPATRWPPLTPPVSTGLAGPRAPDPARGSVTGVKRTRRTLVLVVGLCLLVSGIGLAVGLSVADRPAGGPTRTAPPVSSADRHLAEQLMLTTADLPAGWRVADGVGGGGNSPALQLGEARITQSLARCMGISAAKAALVLGGRAADQTAQSSSPIFVAPTSSASAGSAVELQTAATVVRSHQDEIADFALFGNPKYPQCAATASAAELQLGVDQTSRTVEQPGPATVSTVVLPAPGGVQLTGLLISFDVKAGEANVPVEVEELSLGSQRIEASLQVFALGGTIPGDALAASISTFEQRVASGGKSSVV